MTSQQAVRLLVGENLDESIGVGVRLGATIRRHRELPYLVHNALKNTKHLTTAVYWALLLQFPLQWTILPKAFRVILKLSTTSKSNFTTETLFRCTVFSPLLFSIVLEETGWIMNKMADGPILSVIYYAMLNNNGLKNVTCKQGLYLWRQKAWSIHGN